MNPTTPTGCTVPAPTHPAWNFGDLVIHRVDEIGLPPQTGPWLLPEATKEVLDEASWLRPDFADADALHLASHTFALVADGLRILVDTGIGNSKTRANPAWNDLETDYLQRLAAAGFPPESVDLVITTHLHADHVGWNTRLVDGDWVPTFPHARYLTSRTEGDYWAAAEMDEARRQMFHDSVDPIRESGQYDFVDVPGHGHEVTAGVRLVPAPGHTPGQIAVELRGTDRTALITGDSIHHPVQLSHPHLTSCVDIDPRQAVRTRGSLLDNLAGTHALLLGTHFPQPTAGTVSSDNGRYRLHSEPGTETPSSVA
ncbi:MBL fold metallo-hydrolase [Streptomyces turgidiscabies]|uniref:Metallo-beta-lactamase domain protein n=1 Tax=Streptomyces turgidiscabies (strain Car8) TaxID=698760 RepID=L7EXU5_STRT8|nr:MULTISPECIES: MBL fold metallo-hydrolase [Streptomyces]ELP63205.1 metallo-beta-lactamase domain protein [Streptomyces turgidiscabies Car8]MDX3499678.1 MBL fold metallo-hydrolase [Streptomyces turgidiscabies]GAQ73377.1 metallo-beta-lactamase superfamily protein [Streptomyces turgidiscabies]